MKKYGHLVTFVGQKYFNLSLPAGCLTLNTPALISVAGTHQSSKLWGKQPPSRAFPTTPANPSLFTLSPHPLHPAPTKVTVLTSKTTALSTTIGNKATTFFLHFGNIDVRKIGKPLAQGNKKKKRALINKK